MSRVALALGLIEEAMGELAASTTRECRNAAYDSLKRARNLLLQAVASDAARVPLALLTPITSEEVE